MARARLALAALLKAMEVWSIGGRAAPGALACSLRKGPPSVDGLDLEPFDELRATGVDLSHPEIA